MATFSILLREDAVEGSIITVNVSTSAIGDERCGRASPFTYGEAAGDAMPMPEMTLGDPSITSVMSDRRRHGDRHADAWRQRRPALDLGTAH